MTSCNSRTYLCIVACLLCLFSSAGQTVCQFPQRPAHADSVDIVVERLSSNINTSFSEYCGFQTHDSDFWFTSMRADAMSDHERYFETNWYCYIYKAKLDEQNKFSQVQALPRTINNPKYYNSNFCFSDGGNRLLFTRCVSSEDGELKCSLWNSERKKHKWTKPKPLLDPINLESYSSMQPYIVENQDYSVLYFVSDRPGGYGGLDIWYSIFNDEKFQTPVNLGPLINTEGNEVTPYYDENLKKIFFSTDERKGFGDYDIWASNGALARWDSPQLLPKPFNSEYNDLYFNINPDGRSAFFSSNRPSYDYSDDDTCCNDIYRADWRFLKKDSAEEQDTAIAIRAKIASVLPIALYFQNDSPDPRSVSDTTAKNYYELYKEYLSEFQEYIRGAGIGLDEEEHRNAMYVMNRFLRDSVQTGYDRLERLINYLEDAMRNGDTIVLSIKGFASPLHNSDYNRHLSSRRIVSLLNYLRTAKKGALAPYINSGRLLLNTAPEGAVNHDFESDNIRETVYSIKAAKDRKIVISVE